MPAPLADGERVAIMSDIHGNLTALEAVLAHIRASGISRIFNLGDLVGKGPNSAAVVDRCREVCEMTVQGNWDADMANPARTGWASGNWHRKQLGDERLEYLANLPGTFDFMVSGRQARLFHASERGIFERVHATAPREQLRDMFRNTPFTGPGPEPVIVGYGDIHTPYVVNFGGHTLFNVGSVGNPLDMPLACYAVLEGRLGDPAPALFSVNLVHLPYDIEAEIGLAQSSGMPHQEQYAHELRTAEYRRRAGAAPAV
ncbi:serine/threonine protein phosphatase [Devosia pacifica]|uniref:Serine/threonine protein phosphatase n=1 Tax=Devosia pacifica TaxID=1335967 RepID=A0A918S3C7_9HYPH|nr:metallophosphoesterase family protein [Devosia pacifica]GHA18734.1 serine/threonine protein phosphatase [Devosia pacifica]